MGPICQTIVGAIAFGLLVAGNVCLVRYYAKLLQERMKGRATAKHAYMNLLSRSYWGVMVPIDLKDKRIFSLILRKYRERSILYSISYWLVFMTLWGPVRSICCRSG
jgi:hypothetical protein